MFGSQSNLGRLAWLAIASLGAICPSASGAADADRPARSSLIAVNEAEGTVSIIDPVTLTERRRVSVGGFAGHEAAASPDGRFAYVPIYGDGNAGTPGSDGTVVAKLDLRSGAIVGQYVFPKGVRPHDAVLGPHDGLLYVTSELDHSVTIIDPVTMRFVAAVPTGQDLSHMIAISSDGRYGYVSNIASGSVSILDLASRRLIGVIPVSDKVQRIAVSVDGKTAFTADQTSPRIAIIDTAAKKVAGSIRLPAPGMGLTATADGRYLLVAIEPTSQVAVVDLRTLSVSHLIDLPQYPHEIVGDAKGEFFYVSLSKADEIAKIRSSDWSVAGVMKSGPFVDGLAWSPRNG